MGVGECGCWCTYTKIILLINLCVHTYVTMHRPMHVCLHTSYMHVTDCLALAGHGYFCNWKA